MQALAQLEPKYRQVIALRFFNQISHAEAYDKIDDLDGAGRAALVFGQW